MDEPTLDEHIQELKSLCAVAADDDLPWLKGMLGGAYVELYERDSEPEALDLAIHNLNTAVVAADNEHPDMGFWCFALGVAHAYRAELFDAVDDYDQAVEWFGRLHAGLTDTHPGYEDAALMLAGAHFDRYYEVRHGSARDAVEALGDADMLVNHLSRLQLHGDSRAATNSRLLLGLARLIRFEIGQDRADLAGGIDLVSAALEPLPPDARRYALAGSWLNEAYRQRAELDGTPADLDLAIATGERLLREYNADDLDRVMLEWVQAEAYEARLGYAENRIGPDRADLDRTDLDRAIALWRVTLERGLRTWPAGRCGHLLRRRAEISEDASDLPEAIRLLEFAAESGEASADDDSQAWQGWHELGQAHLAHWQLAREPGSLAAAADCADRSLELRPPDGTDTLAVHDFRVMAAVAALGHEAGQPHTEPPPSAARLRTCLEDARTALEVSLSAPAERRALSGIWLAYAQMYLAGHTMDDLDPDMIRDLISGAAEVGTAAARWRDLTGAAEGVVQHMEAVLGPDSGGDHGIGKLIQAASAEHVDGIAEIARGVLPLALHARGAYQGELRATRAAAKLMQEVRIGESQVDHETAVLADMLTAIDAGRRGDYAFARELTERARVALDARPPSLTSERTLRPMVRFFLTILSLGTDEPLIEDLPPDMPLDREVTGRELVELIVNAATQLVSSLRRSDMAGTSASCARLAELAGRVPIGHPARLFAAGLAGTGELAMARKDPSDTGAADRSAAWFDEFSSATGDDHPLRTVVSLSLAESLRRSGPDGRARSRRLGMEALRAQARWVLLQTGTDHAIDSARAASSHAGTVAGWCLEDRAPEDAIAVLDAGRGLVLNSATASREVADMLARLGHDDLAQEWLKSAGMGRDQLTGEPLPAVAEGEEVPDDLRSRVLRALEADQPVSSTLLASVSVAEIRDALRSVGADALIYLVPGSGAQTGNAVVVAARGPIDVLALPKLQTGDDSPIAWQVKSLGTRRDVSPGRTDDGQSRRRLDELCRWAWTAAMQALVGLVREWDLGRPAHLVLIPMGSLGLVPWHAAYAETARGRHYAVRDAAFSYNVSAKMFCAAMAYPVQPSESALVVGDPLGDLPFAGAEARAIHGRFYPFGRYLGRPDEQSSDPAEPGEILRWLGSDATGPSTLHFACHATVDLSRPVDSHLILAGGTLTARRLLEASRLATLVINRVFLAACTTNVGGADYDEAFSLATAFLAAGAHTVFGSLWPVPDEDTSVLMYMVHHYLNLESCPPAEALHRTQLWMLDPARPVPDSMPLSLRSCAERPECADPMSWAAFTHLGR